MQEAPQPQIAEVAVTQLSAENMVQLGQAGYDFYMQSLQNPQVLIFRQRVTTPLPATAPPETDHQDGAQDNDEEEISTRLRARAQHS